MAKKERKGWDLLGKQSCLLREGKQELPLCGAQHQISPLHTAPFPSGGRRVFLGKEASQLAVLLRARPSPWGAKVFTKPEAAQGNAWLLAFECGVSPKAACPRWPSPFRPLLLPSHSPIACGMTWVGDLAVMAHALFWSYRLTALFTCNSAGKSPVQCTWERTRLTTPTSQMPPNCRIPRSDPQPLPSSGVTPMSQYWLIPIVCHSNLSGDALYLCPLWGKSVRTVTHTICWV